MIEASREHAIRKVIERIESQIRTLEDYKWKQVKTYEKEIDKWRKHIENLEKQKEKFERKLENKIRELEARKRALEKKI
jgi:uncharacterized protein YukE